MTKIEKVIEKANENSDIEEWIKSLYKSSFSGSLVIFDITGSTNLKDRREFPAWIKDWRKIYQLV